ncbi:MAG: energy-coupled thiamine transporter ThiT [Clostridia bacterium]|nr:energy-coupled thiamine transporter ThiT [Clostridia bacterium]
MNPKTRALNESAILIALATILSVLKIVDLPYGGSITFASMLPIIIISYRHGVGYGLISGLVYGVLQQLLGLKTLSYVSTWQSIVAVIVLDYVLAFTIIGLGGIFRKSVKNQSASLALGSFAVCIIRYVCHVLSGATVWAGISIPTKAALIYSVGYNATYMIPETIIVVLAAAYLGSALDFKSETPVRIKSEITSGNGSVIGKIVPGLLIVVGLIADIVLIFSKLQNAETGEFDFSQLADVNWLTVAIISCVAVASALFVWMRMGKKSDASSKTN